MSTHNRLHDVVTVSRDELRTQLGTIGDYAKEIKRTPAELRTDDEAAVLKIASMASKKSSLPLINLATALKAGGVRDDGFPHLAVAHYETSIAQGRVHVSVESDGSLKFSGQRAERYQNWELGFSEGVMPTVKGLRSWPYPIDASAVVPLVPAILRQKDTEDIYLLFEVADWRPEVRVEIDPFLLKLVVGNIYAILGTWDVTKRELDAYQFARDMGI